MTSSPATGSTATATVIGLGSAGRIAAHRAAARGWEVTAFDPAGGTLPSTIGVWCEQLPSWLPDNFLTATFRPDVILADGTRRPLGRTYGVINKESLRHLGGYRVERRALPPHAPTTADHTIVTTGRTHAASGRRGQVRQLAIGHVFPLSDVPCDCRQPVLMDFTPASASAAVDGDGDEPASFSYRIALDSDTFLIEETILAVPVDCVGDEADDTKLLDLLRRRQRARLASLGLSEDQALEEEVVSFPLLAQKPGRGERTPDGRAATAALFGFAGGWMHPATGYSVGAVLAGVDDFLAELESRRVRPRRSSLSGLVLADPCDLRRYVQRTLRERGLAALLGFDAEQTAQFFSAFFSLPEEDVFAYLIGSSPLRTLRAMAKVAVPLMRVSPLTCAGLVVGFLRGPGRWRS